MTQTIILPSRAFTHPLIAPPDDSPAEPTGSDSVSAEATGSEPVSAGPSSDDVELVPSPPADVDTYPTPTAPRVPPDFVQQSSLLMQTYQAIQPAQLGIDDLTRTMESASAQSRTLHDQTAVLHAVESAMTDVSSKDDKQHDLTTLMVRIGDGPPVSARRALDDIGLGGSFPDNTATLRMTGKVGEQLSERTSAVNQDTSLQMIRLQELMHQKNLFLQLATNLASAEEQITRRIAENIR